MESFASQLKYFWDGKSRLVLIVPKFTPDVPGTLEVFARDPHAQVHLISIVPDALNATQHTILLPAGCRCVVVYSATAVLDFLATVMLEGPQNAAQSAAVISPDEVEALRARDLPGRLVSASVAQGGTWGLDERRSPLDPPHAYEVYIKPEVGADFSQQQLIALRNAGARLLQRFETATNPDGGLGVRLLKTAFALSVVPYLSITTEGYRTIETPEMASESTGIPTASEKGYVPRLCIRGWFYENDGFGTALASLRVFHISAQCLRLRDITKQPANVALPLAFGAAQLRALYGGASDAPRPDLPGRHALRMPMAIDGGLEEAGGYLAEFSNSEKGNGEITAKTLDLNAVMIEFCEAALGDEIGVWYGDHSAVQGHGTGICGWRIAPRVAVELGDMSGLSRRYDALKANAGVRAARPGAESAAGLAQKGRPRMSPIEEAFRSIDVSTVGNADSAQETSVDFAMTAAFNQASVGGQAFSSGSVIPPDQWICIAARLAAQEAIPRIEDRTMTPSEQITYLRVVQEARRGLLERLQGAKFCVGPCDGFNKLASHLEEVERFDWKEYWHSVATRRDDAIAALKRYQATREGNKPGDLADLRMIAAGMRIIRADANKARELLPARENPRPSASDASGESGLELLAVIERILSNVANDDNSLCVRLRDDQRWRALGLSDLGDLEKGLRSTGAHPKLPDGNEKIDKLATLFGLEKISPDNYALLGRPMRAESWKAIRDLAKERRSEEKDALSAVNGARDLPKHADDIINRILATAAYKQLSEVVLPTIKDEAERRRLKRGLDLWPLGSEKAWKEFGSPIGVAPSTAKTN